MEFKKFYKINKKKYKNEDKLTAKVLEVNKHQVNHSSAVNQQKTTVITSSTKDDDEWESF